MKAVIQRVKSASVTIDGKQIAAIGPGILTLLGLEAHDAPNGIDASAEAKLAKLVTKIVELRIFPDPADPAGKMNLSLKDVQGEHLIVSQFTLAGDCSTGRRPSFGTAMRPELAKPMWELSLKLSEASGIRTQGGIFQADMKVSLLNDGPVTFILET
jgi:D-tyrosyl-tRNA(Tyr) deacylase